MIIQGVPGMTYKTYMADRGGPESRVRNSRDRDPVNPEYLQDWDPAIPTAGSRVFSGFLKQFKKRIYLFQIVCCCGINSKGKYIQSEGHPVRFSELKFRLYFCFFFLVKKLNLLFFNNMAIKKYF